MMRMHARWLLAGAILTAATLIATDARAQRGNPGPASRIGAHAIFGFGGEADVDLEGRYLDLGREPDLLTTFGFGLVFEHAVHRYVLLGGRFEAAWWNTEEWEDDPLNVDRNVWLDFSPQAKVRYPFDLGDATAEVSFTVPFGLTVSIPDDDWPNDLDTAAGFNVGALGGFALVLRNGFGFYGEAGFRWHTVYHQFQDTETDVDVAAAQFVLHLGVMLGL